MNWAPLPTDNILHNPHVRLVVVGLERPESVPPSVSPLPPSSPRRRRQRPENLPPIAGGLFLLYPAMSSQVEKAPNLCFNLHFFFFEFLIWFVADLLILTDLLNCCDGRLSWSGQCWCLGWVILGIECLDSPVVVLNSSPAWNLHLILLLFLICLGESNVDSCIILCYFILLWKSKFWGAVLWAVIDGLGWSDWGCFEGRLVDYFWAEWKKKGV